MMTFHLSKIFVCIVFILSITKAYKTEDPNPGSNLEREFKALSMDLLHTVRRTDFRCPTVCTTILTSTCQGECERRGLPSLPCRLFCYSSQVTCCQCPEFCHFPFQDCYARCLLQDTACKDRCIQAVQSCCSSSGK
nr:uncharacterized protein LOC113819769 [Penaeus vannamei]